MSEMNSGGGSSYEQDPFDQATEQYVAQELRLLDGELEDASQEASRAQQLLAIGQSDTERVAEYHVRSAKLKAWTTSVGGSMVATAVSLNFIEMPRTPAAVGLVSTAIAYAALKTRIKSNTYHARRFQARADLQAERLYPLYIQGYVGELPSWAIESLRYQGYPLPTYPRDTLSQDGENLNWQ